MSEQETVKKRSRRSPAAAAETVASRNPEENVVPEATVESPVDIKSTPTYRLALGAVIILGVLIVVGVGVLIVGLIQGWGSQSEAPAPVKPVKPISMTLAPGYRILSSDTQPGRLVLHVRSETVDEIDIIDLNDGHIITQIHAEAPK
jgi:hypothetical protein